MIFSPFGIEKLSYINLINFRYLIFQNLITGPPSDHFPAHFPALFARCQQQQQRKWAQRCCDPRSPRRAEVLFATNARLPPHHSASAFGTVSICGMPKSSRDSRGATDTLAK